MNLAIIGTAGRGDDYNKLTLLHWFAMLGVARRVIKENGFVRLVSGGAAWADHIAVALAIEDKIIVDLYLPGLAKDKATAEKYHSRFESKTMRNVKAEIELAKSDFAADYIEAGSFKDRNLKVANRATHFLAFTFGDGPKIKDGGTSHTVGLMLEQGKSGWHVDLHDLTTYYFIKA